MPVTRTSGARSASAVDELVAAAPVAQPHGAHMPVVRAGGDELGERQLVQRPRRSTPGRPWRRTTSPTSSARQHHPGQPQAGGQGLAGGAQVDDAVRVEALEGADRLAVVAELAVVVVLQDQAAGAPGPVDGGGPPVGVQRDAGGELVGGGQQDRAHRRIGPSSPVSAPCSSTATHGVARPAACQEIPVDVEAVRLDGDLRTPRCRSTCAEQAAARGRTRRRPRCVPGRRAPRAPGPGSRRARCAARCGPRIAVAEGLGRVRRSARGGRP